MFDRWSTPNSVGLRAEPRSQRDLAIAGHNNWLVALDNISRVQPWLSDALCRLTSGTGFATRELYANKDEALFAGARPVLINGIGEFASRGDLLDRAVIVELGPIDPTARRTEQELSDDFHAMWPRLIGGICQAVADGMGHLDDVQLAGLPRMADFVRFTVAAESSYATPGAFQRAYATTVERAHEIALESSPAAMALHDFASRLTGHWEGNWTELLTAVRRHANTYEGTPNWPRSGRGMSVIYSRHRHELNEFGVVIIDGPIRRGRRTIQLTHRDASSSAASTKDDQARLC